MRSFKYFFLLLSFLGVSTVGFGATTFNEDGSPIVTSTFTYQKRGTDYTDYTVRTFLEGDRDGFVELWKKTDHGAINSRGDDGTVNEETLHKFFNNAQARLAQGNPFALAGVWLGDTLVMALQMGNQPSGKTYDPLNVEHQKYLAVWNALVGVEVGYSGDEKEEVRVGNGGIGSLSAVIPSSTDDDTAVGGLNAGIEYFDHFARHQLLPREKTVPFVATAYLDGASRLPELYKRCGFSISRDPIWKTMYNPEGQDRVLAIRQSSSLRPLHPIEWDRLTDVERPTAE